MIRPRKNHRARDKKKMHFTPSTPHVIPQCTRAARRDCGSSSWSLRARHGAALGLLALLAACGGGSDGSSGGGSTPPPAATSQTIGGTVSGLTALGLVIRAGAESLAIAENGSFTFPKSVAVGTAVTVEVSAQPAWQQCTVANGQFTVGAQPVTNVAITCAGVQARYAYTAAHMANTVNAYRMSDTTGVLTRNTPFRTSTGLEPRAIAGDLQGRFLYVANSGGDTVTAWRIDPATGGLTQTARSPFAAPVQPRALAVHPSGGFLYVAGQGTNSVQAYAIDADSGVLTAIGTALNTGFTPAQAQVTPDGRFLIVLNRGIASFSVYRIEAETGALTEVAGSPFSLGAANAFALHPNGKLLVALDTNISLTDNVTTYAFDATTGAVTRPVRLSLQSAISAAFHPNGTDLYLATTGADPRIHHYTVDAATGQLAVTLDIPPTIFPGATAIAVDPTGRYLEVLTGNVYGYTIDAATRALTVIAPPNATGDMDAQGIVFVR